GRPDRTGVGPGGRVPAVDDGDLAAEHRDAEDPLGHAADGTGAGEVDLDVRGGGDAAVQLGQHDAEGGQRGVQFGDRVLNPRRLTGGRGALEAVHGHQVGARVDLADPGGDDAAGAGGHQVHAGADVALVVDGVEDVVGLVDQG